MSKNKNKMRSGVAIAAMHRNSAGPMRHRLALRGNARTKAEAEAISEYEAEATEIEYEAYCSEY
jgi:hypothetical protein